MFQVESQCPKCGHKNQDECETWKERSEGTKRDLNISVKDLAKDDACYILNLTPIVCQECSEKYMLLDSANWDKIETTVKKEFFK